MRESQVGKPASPGKPLLRSHERFLGTRTGILLISQQIHAQIEDAALVSSHEEREGILVSLLIGFHQLCFVLLILLTDGTG